MTKPRSFLVLTLLLVLANCVARPLCAQTPSQGERPNIVLIYADDLGLGDVGAYGASAVRTPHIDRIAAEGIRFIDAHSAAATCTPSRYAMLTGVYAWRKKGTGIAAGDAALIIDPGAITLASIMREGGYTSTVVGKWHLGVGSGNLDWNGEIAPGPLELGFDECFLIPATGDRVPTVFVENHRVVGLDPADPLRVRYHQRIGEEPTGADHPELLRQPLAHGHDQTIHNGISRIGYMSGGGSARWVDEDIADTLTDRACEFIDRQAAAQQRFFLFFSLHDIHVPRTPHARFVGKTQMGPRGDAIVQADWCVGRVLQRLDDLGLSENTLVIFTSDNGPVLNDGYLDEAEPKVGEHDPTGGYRGGKYSAFEAGTRVPMLVRWPGQIEAGQTSGAMMSQIDFCACFASLAGVTLRPRDCLDSQEHMPAMLGHDDRGRWYLVKQSGTLALRHGEWKYIEPAAGPAVFTTTNIETGLSRLPQLYNLDRDPQERDNVAAKHRRRVAEMAEVLRGVRKEGEF